MNQPGRSAWSEGPGARLLRSVAAAAARHARPVLALAAALGVLAALAASQLSTTAATSTFVSSSSSEYRDTQAFYAKFGEEPVVVLVRGDLQKLVLSEDLYRLVGLEGCLSGNVPAAALAAEGGANGPCAQLGRAHSVKVVLGPGTFVNEAAEQINEQLAVRTKAAQSEAATARSAVEGAALKNGLGTAQAKELGAQAAHITTTRFEEAVAKLALEYGLTSKPSIQNKDFISALVFDSTKPAGTPKQRFAYLFPSRDSALISVRLRSGLSEAQRNHTIALIRSAVAMPQWHLANGENYLVTGVPVIVADLPGAIGSAIEVLMVAVLLVMAATLGLIFGGRPRLLPLALALLATALTFGALAVAGSSLTMASIAVLPVLIGLAVDYAIQFQSRAEEELREGAGGQAAAAGAVAAYGSGAAPAEGERAAAVERGAAAGGPTIVTAGAASAAAMLVLLLSPVPMVRGFGALLVAGVAVALACALYVGAAALSLPWGTRRAREGEGAGRGAAPGAGRTGGASTGGAGAALRSGAGAVAAAWRGAGELLMDNPLTRLVSRTALERSVRSPGRVLAVGLALAALGWGLDTQTHVETDITKLVPQDLGSLQGVLELERRTGVAGEIDLMVSGRNVASPAVIEWMSRYQQAVLAHAGYSASAGCGHAKLCPAFSLPDLFGTAAGGKLTQAQVSSLLAAVPPYFSQEVITPDRSAATIAFGVKVMSLQSQQRLIESMRSQLHPPAGVSAHLVGLPVLAARSAAQVSDPWRRLLSLLAGLAAVALVLAAAFRGDGRRTLAPLVPIVLATGWSALVLFATRVPLNPMSVTLGALVIAISTEFSVLLSERHRQERLAGHDAVTALRRTYSRTGAAVAASGVTATAGFGVLALSKVAMLRDFGLVTLIDLAVSLVGVLVSLPAAVMLAERRAERRGRSPAPGGAGGQAPPPSALREQALAGGGGHGGA